MRTSSDITSESKGYANKFGYELLYEIAPQHIGSNFQREKTDEMFFISELNAPRLRITPCIWLRAIALHPNFALAKLQIHIKSEIAPTI